MTEPLICPGCGAECSRTSVSTSKPWTCNVCKPNREELLAEVEQLKQQVAEAQQAESRATLMMQELANRYGVELLDVQEFRVESAAVMEAQIPGPTFDSYKDDPVGFYRDCLAGSDWVWKHSSSASASPATAKQILRQLPKAPADTPTLFGIPVHLDPTMPPGVGRLENGALFCLGVCPTCNLIDGCTCVPTVEVNRG